MGFSTFLGEGVHDVWNSCTSLHWRQI